MKFFHKTASTEWSISHPWHEHPTNYHADSGLLEPTFIECVKNIFAHYGIKIKLDDEQLS